MSFRRRAAAAGPGHQQHRCAKGDQYAVDPGLMVCRLSQQKQAAKSRQVETRPAERRLEFRFTGGKSRVWTPAGPVGGEGHGSQCSQRREAWEQHPAATLNPADQLGRFLCCDSCHVYLRQ